MNLRRPLPTDRRLWARCAVVSFVLLGFVHLHTSAVEDKVGPSHFWGMVVYLPEVAEWWTATATLAVVAAVLAVPAVVFGWVAQAVIVAVRAVRT